MNADELEAHAQKARRLADIARHKPLSEEEIDSYGHEACKKTGHAQINLMELALELQNAYAIELRVLWDAIKVLRLEALYWRNKYQQEVKQDQ